MQKYIAEFVGTLVFLTVIAKSSSTGVLQPWAIATGLLAAIFLMGDISGGHFNPAVSVMMMLKGDMSQMETAYYVIAQVLGGAAALQLATFK